MSETKKRGRPPKPKASPAPPKILKQPQSMSGGHGDSPVVCLRLPQATHDALRAFMRANQFPTISAAARAVIEGHFAKPGD